MTGRRTGGGSPLGTLVALGTAERTRRALAAPSARPTRRTALDPTGTDPMSAATHPSAPTLVRTAPAVATPWSTTMYSMNEALAREHQREALNRAVSARLARDLAAQRRWHRVSRYAQRAEARHAARVRQLAVH